MGVVFNVSSVMSETWLSFSRESRRVGLVYYA
jgi:hypothetical protein